MRGGHHEAERFALFGAVGGLVGAFLNTRIQSPALNIVFGALLLFAGISAFTGVAE